MQDPRNNDIIHSTPEASVSCTSSPTEESDRLKLRSLIGRPSSGILARLLSNEFALDQISVQAMVSTYEIGLSERLD